MGNESAVVLSEKDRARKKINVWHGSSNNWINMLKELTGNSLDIFKNDKLNHINIKIHNRNKIEYFDDACGIPVEVIASNGLENYKALFEIPFAGTKYGNEEATVGCNGVYLWTLAMTCENITFNIARPNGNIYNVSYHKGDRVEDMKIIGKSDTTYTNIIFELDKEVWDNPNFTFEEIKSIVKGQSSLSNVLITLEDLENNIKEEYRYENGILDYFNELTSNKEFILSEPIKITKNNIEQKITKNNIVDKINLNMYFNISNDSNDNIQKDFLNTADLILHGTVYDGIINGFKKSIDEYLKNNDMYDKKDKPITKEDIVNSLNFIADVRSLQCEYVSQVKQRTESKHYVQALSNAIIDFLNIYFTENRVYADLICKQILINSRARIKADITRKDIIKKLGDLASDTKKVKIENLKECNMNKSNLEERILLICEGLSAMSGITNSFDNRYMGCLGLRGRFISSLKKSVSDVLNNVPAYTLIKALGCGIEIPYEERKQFKDVKTFDKSKLRYGNIGILVDSDCFGMGISLSLLTFIYKYMPELLKEGRVYIIITPRYEIKLKNGKMVYAYNDREKDELLRNDIKEEDISHVGIVKGLAELNSDDFWNKVLCEEAREKTFIQVDYNETEEVVSKLFNDYMGKDTAPRKEFVNKFITNINLDEIG